MIDEKRYLLKKAFKIIRRNYGCPGNDGVSISNLKRNYKEYESLLLHKLENNTYVFEHNPKYTIISDYLGKERGIFVYNVTDRWIQELIKLQLEPFVEETLTDYTYAFRRGKTDLDSYRYILKNNPNYILRVDIKNYFKSINKEKLLESLEEIKIEDSLLNLIKKSFLHCKEGLPSGHVLSCILSNFYLRNLDLLFPYGYTRYSDDMMFGVQTMEDVHNIFININNLLKDYGFELNMDKIKIIKKPNLDKLL